MEIQIDRSDTARLERQIKYLIATFITGLVISGVTAFPIDSQLAIACQWIQTNNVDNAVTQWIQLVYKGVNETYVKYPFIAYGTDWLAFAHLVIAIAFIGPFRDPVKNVWVIEFGLIACVAIFPLAFVAGYVREIPVFWQLIDCSFGIIGGGLLLLCHRRIKKLEQMRLT